MSQRPPEEEQERDGGGAGEAGGGRRNSDDVNEEKRMNPPSEDEKEKRRYVNQIKLEQRLSEKFLGIFQRHQKDVSDRRDMMKEGLSENEKRRLLMKRRGFGGDSVNDGGIVDFTASEYKILSKRNYQEWTKGTITGVVAFGLLYGFNLWRSTKKRQFPTTASASSITGSLRRQWNSIWSVSNAPETTATAARATKAASSTARPATTAPKASPSSAGRNSRKMNFIELDRRGKSPSSVMKQNQGPHSSSQFPPTSSLPPPPPPSSSGASALNALNVSDDLWQQIQFLVYAMISAFVTNITAQILYVDRSKYFSNLATMPLQSGKSYLCHQMCPDLVRDLQQEEEKQRQQGQPDGSNSNNDVDDDERVTVKEVIEDPITKEFASMLQMVRNCEQRMQYEHDYKAELNEELRQRRRDQRQRQERERREQQEATNALDMSPGTNGPTSSSSAASSDALSPATKSGNDDEDNDDMGVSDDEPIFIPEPGVPEKYLGYEIAAKETK